MALHRQEANLGLPCKARDMAPAKLGLAHGPGALGMAGRGVAVVGCGVSLGAGASIGVWQLDMGGTVETAPGGAPITGPPPNSPTAGPFPQELQPQPPSQLPSQQPETSLPWCSQLNMGCSERLRHPDSKPKLDAAARAAQRMRDMWRSFAGETRKGFRRA